MPDPELLLASKRCSQCLTTRNRIVEGERAAEIVRECRRKGVHFVCHKGTATNQIIHCRGVHEIMGGSRAHLFAQQHGIPIREIDPDEVEL
jgi:hypothetical protein